MTAPAGAADSTTVHAVDARRVLTLFAEGLAGRSLHLRPDAAADPLGRVSVIGSDGETIVVPEAIDAFDSERHNFGAYLVAVARQVAQFEHGTFQFSIGHDFERAPEPRLLATVFAAIEDRRIDRVVEREYPGARPHLDRVRARGRAQRPSPAALPLGAALVETVVQFSLGAANLALLPRHAGVQRRIVRLATGVDADGATVHDSARIALAICALIMAAVNGMASDSETGIEAALDALAAAVGSVPTDSGDAVVEGDVEARPADEPMGPSLDVTGALTAASAADESMAGRPGTLPDDVEWSIDPDALAPDAGDETSGDRARRRAVRARPPEAADRSYLYDEWDYHRQGYLRAWCRVHEHRLHGDDHRFHAEVRRRHADLATRVRRTFRFVRPESWQRVHGTDDGEDLDFDAVITAMVDRRAGHLTTDHVYVRRDRGRREVAAAFLLDVSASTSAFVPDPDAPPAPGRDEDEDDFLTYLQNDDRASAAPERRVLDVSKDALALMCDALQILGDDHAVYGFSGEGREGVEFYVAKEFRDAPSPRTWAGLAAMEPRRYTRMGPAIRHATVKLAGQPARTKVLVVVSDGYPQDTDYGPDRGDNEYGLHDTARALKEAERAHISTFCVTVDPAGHDYLRRMCAEDRYLVIDDVTALPRELIKVYRALTAVRSRALVE